MKTRIQNLIIHLHSIKRKSIPLNSIGSKDAAKVCRDIYKEKFRLRLNTHSNLLWPTDQRYRWEVSWKINEKLRNGGLGKRWVNKNVWVRQQTSEVQLGSSRGWLPVCLGCRWFMDPGGGKLERAEQRRSSKLGPDPDPTLSDAASFVMILAENIFSALKD